MAASRTSEERPIEQIDRLTGVVQKLLEGATALLAPTVPSPHLDGAPAIFEDFLTAQTRSQDVADWESDLSDCSFATRSFLQEDCTWRCAYSDLVALFQQVVRLLDAAQYGQEATGELTIAQKTYVVAVAAYCPSTPTFLPKGALCATVLSSIALAPPPELAQQAYISQLENELLSRSEPLPLACPHSAVETDFQLSIDEHISRLAPTASGSRSTNSLTMVLQEMRKMKRSAQRQFAELQRAIADLRICQEDYRSAEEDACTRVAELSQTLESCRQERDACRDELQLHRSRLRVVLSQFAASAEVTEIPPAKPPCVSSSTSVERSTGACLEEEIAALEAALRSCPPGQKRKLSMRLSLLKNQQTKRETELLLRSYQEKSHSIASKTSALEISFDRRRKPLRSASFRCNSRAESPLPSTQSEFCDSRADTEERENSSVGVAGDMDATPEKRSDGTPSKVQSALMSLYSDLCGLPI